MSDNGKVVPFHAPDRHPFPQYVLLEMFEVVSEVALVLGRRSEGGVPCQTRGEEVVEFAVTVERPGITVWVRLLDEVVVEIGRPDGGAELGSDEWCADEARIDRIVGYCRRKGVRCEILGEEWVDG